MVPSLLNRCYVTHILTAAEWVWGLATHISGLVTALGFYTQYCLFPRSIFSRDAISKKNFCEGALESQYTWNCWQYWLVFFSLAFDWSSFLILDSYWPGLARSIAVHKGYKCITFVERFMPLENWDTSQIFSLISIHYPSLNTTKYFSTISIQVPFYICDVMCSPINITPFFTDL